MGFFKGKKIFLAIIVLTLIVGGAIYFVLQKPEKEKTQKEVLGCQNIPDLPDGSIKLVTKIIDGDTFLIEGGYSVRILGIDADEKDYPCYEAAKRKLKELILNKEVRLEKGKENLDQYCRYLRYVFKDNKNISLELVKEGLVVARFSSEDKKYREEISKAEKEAREKNVGCKWSSFAKALDDKSSFIEERKTKFQWEKLTPEKLGFEVFGACLAEKYLGKKLIVEGKIVDTYRHLKSNTVFLNFEKPYPNQCFTGVIFSSNLYKFVQNPEDYYLKKRVRIFGEIKEYKGRPEIILEDPSQIEIGK